jgi:hypothetical protein
MCRFSRGGILLAALCCRGVRVGLGVFFLVLFWDSMKKLLLAGVAALALASTPGYAADVQEEQPRTPSQVTVTPQVYGPPPIGWVYSARARRAMVARSCRV